MCLKIHLALIKTKAIEGIFFPPNNDYQEEIMQDSRNVPKSSRKLLLMTLGFFNRPDARSHLESMSSDGSTWDVMSAWWRCNRCFHHDAPSKLRVNFQRLLTLIMKRRHNKRPLLSYHSVLTSSNRVKGYKYSRLFDFCRFNCNYSL